MRSGNYSFLLDGEVCAHTETEFNLEQATSIGKRYHEPRTLLQVALRCRASKSSRHESSDPASAGTTFTGRTGQISDSAKADIMNVILRIEGLALDEHWSSRWMALLSIITT